jgi:uncharacterized protein (DUF58 family)
MIFSLYLTPRFFTVVISLVILFLFGFIYPAIFAVAKLLLIALGVLLLLDSLLLYRLKKGFFARRLVADRLSNGDENEVSIYLENNYPFAAKIEIIDEIPFQFQQRDVLFNEILPANTYQTIGYKLRPVERGEYSFGAVNVFVQSDLGLVRRRYTFDNHKMVAVYPSYMQMRKYELIAFSNRLQDYGVKKIRRIGQSMEFEQIKNYVAGDDYRVINWKATARRNDLMVNQFQDEKSQQVYSLIDKGRVMKMPFAQLSLLDYAINATLVIANIAIKKGDKAGMISFAEQVETIVKASKQGSQMRQIQEHLYRETTRFLETDYEKLYISIRRTITQRSLLILYTNFETLSGLQRQLPFLAKLSKRHLLVVVFFENTELKQLIDKPAHDVAEIYQKTIAEKFNYEKRQIVKELHKHGIQTILTPPQLLTVNTINKYLELKARGMI